MYFTLQATPEIINGPKNQMVSVGTTVTLKCDVVSNPPASVAWTFPQVRYMLGISYPMFHFQDFFQLVLYKEVRN